MIKYTNDWRIDMNQILDTKSVIKYNKRCKIKNKIYYINDNIRAFFCVHEFDFGELQPFTDVYGNRVLIQKCTKCGKRRIKEYENKYSKVL